MAKLISLPRFPKVFFDIITLCSFLILLHTTGCVFHKVPNPTPKGLQYCPDAWIVNLMPVIDTSFAQNSYFICNGVRKERSEFDLEWVSQNCKTLKPDTVY